MATKYPIYFDKVRMLINPENIVVAKTSNVSEVRTFAGTVFQYWPDLPDIIKINGRVNGSKAFSELKYLQNHFEKIGKQVSMIYKTREYQGFFMNFEVDAESSLPGIFKYSFDFKIVSPHFESRDFAIGHIPSLNEEIGSVAQEFQDILDALKNISIKI